MVECFTTNYWEYVRKWERETYLYRKL